MRFRFEMTVVVCLALTACGSGSRTTSESAVGFEHPTVVASTTDSQASESVVSSSVEVTTASTPTSLAIATDLASATPEPTPTAHVETPDELESKLANTSRWETAGCGFAFTAARDDETIGIHVNLLAEIARLAESQDPGDLPDGVYSIDLATASETSSYIVFGGNLFADWCSDMAHPDRDPFELNRWPIVAGTVDLTLSGTSAAGTLSEIVAIRDDGKRVTLPKPIRVVNDNWGYYAG